jgi:hypothetical protein
LWLSFFEKLYISCRYYLVVIMKTSNVQGHPKSGRLVCILLVIVLGGLFWRCFLPDYVLFSNDGPLGLQMSTWQRLPQAFLGQWYDMNSLGINAGASLPDLSTLIRWMLGPVGYAKFVIPIGLWFLGAAAYFFFRRIGLTAMASTLGGLAACLTTGFFSNACWGAAPPTIAFGMDFVALGMLAKRDKLPFWIAPALGGMAVGMNVMEAADIGALFSMVIAAFVIYQSVVENGGPVVLRVARGMGRTIVVAGFACFIAAYAVSVLVGASIKGISGMQQDEKTKEARWDFATSWSMPKWETLALVVPNLYGCNVITPGSGNYWGGLGRDPKWDRYFASDEKGPPPDSRHFIRHTGRGIYLGSAVVILALWGVLQSLRKKDSVLTPMERKLVWFWLAVGIVSLLFAFGRFTPFYRLIYNLPYFSTIRNPDKFLHIFTFAVIILFGFGLHGLQRRYLDAPLVNAPEGRLKRWWSQVSAFDRRWVVGSIIAIFVTLVAWGVYAASRGRIENHLLELQRLSALANGRGIDEDATRAFVVSQVSLSLKQVGWFVLCLVLISVLLFLIFGGMFSGSRASWASILLGVLLIGDLGRADWPYIICWNYKEKYETYGPDPVIKFLADKPHEHRVAELPFRPPDQLAGFDNLYRIEWTQQLFPYYNIQTLDIVQMPRMPQDLEAFDRALQLPGVPPLTRYWALANNRYLLGPAGYLAALNQQLDPALHRFRIITNFDVVPKPFVEIPNGVPLDRIKEYAQMLPLNYQTATPRPEGDYALFEFAGALPRAKLYSNWQINSPAALSRFTTNGMGSDELALFEMTGTNDFLTLKELTSSSFDPATTVLLPEPLPVSAKPVGTNQNSGEVKIVRYAPADIELDATATGPSVLMMCDKYDPDWQVWVDGKKKEVLRCDYLLRGVYLEPGHHEVEFKFRPNIKMLYVDLAAIFVGICLLSYVGFVTRKQAMGGDRASARTLK